jgi:hypothetical protein
MIKNSALGVVCALAFVACPKSNPVGDSSKAPAQTQPQTPAAAASATASIKVRGETISFDHFEVVDPVFATLSSLTGVVAQISSRATDRDSGLGVLFSGDPACHYADGAVFQLTDPCIFLSYFAPVENPDPTTVGVVNVCQSKIRGVTGIVAGCPPNLNGPVVPMVTTGTLTLRRWSPSGPIDFSFSPGAQLTGIFMRPVVQTNPVFAYDTVAVPISGTVSASR